VKRGQKQPLREYQQALINAYYDIWTHRMPDPLYEAFQQWKRGDLHHDELTELIHGVNREKQRVYSFFTQSRDPIISFIKLNQAWFADWRANHPPCSGDRTLGIAKDEYLPAIDLDEVTARNVYVISSSLKIR
jgi:hypothetical protein